MAETALPVLVTAVGSELACSILNAARQAEPALRIHGCDAQSAAVGTQWCSSFSRVSLARHEEEFLGDLARIVESKKIRFILPAAEAEFPALARARESFHAATGCRVLINSFPAWRTFSDKWRAACFYRQHDLPAPRTYDAATLEELERRRAELEFPMVMKPRSGGGSRFVFVVKSWDDVVRCQPVVPQPILQAHAGPDEEEYTAGTYRTATNEVYVILMRRKLKFGMTNSAETVLDRPDLEEFCRSVIRGTDLEGVNNIQFRVSDQGPRILEINPRFSGTAGIRAHCGFNEVSLWVREATTGRPPDMPVIRPCRVLRYMTEYYCP